MGKTEEARLLDYDKKLSMRSCRYPNGIHKRPEKMIPENPCMSRSCGTSEEVVGRLVMMIPVNPRLSRSRWDSEKLHRRHEKRIPVNPCVHRPRDSAGWAPNVHERVMLRQEVEE